MIPERLTYEELAETFDGEWVVVCDPEFDPLTLEVISGIPIAHNIDRDKMFAEAIPKKPRHSAILCFAKPPENSVLVM